MHLSCSWVLLGSLPSGGLPPLPPRPSVCLFRRFFAGLAWLFRVLLLACCFFPSQGRCSGLWRCSDASSCPWLGVCPRPSSVVGRRLPLPPPQPFITQGRCS
jgi:hypothetical protein